MLQASMCNDKRLGLTAQADQP